MLPRRSFHALKAKSPPQAAQILPKSSKNAASANLEAYLYAFPSLMSHLRSLASAPASSRLAILRLAAPRHQRKAAKTYDSNVKLHAKNPHAHFLAQLSDSPWGVQSASESWGQNVLPRHSDGSKAKSRLQSSGTVTRKEANLGRD